MLRITLAILFSLYAGALTAQPYVVGAGANVKNADTALALSVGVGYGLGRHVAAEISYADLGEVARTASSSTDARGAKASLVATVPLWRLAVLGTVSAYRLRASLTTPLDMSTASGTVYAVGLGISYRLTESVSLRAVVERARREADFFGPGRDLDHFRSTSVGLAWRF